MPINTDQHDALRRRHVQLYTQGVRGFCCRCRVAILRREALSGFRSWKCARCGGQTAVIDVEIDKVQVMTKDGEKLETTPDGWRRMSVRGEEVYTKSVTSSSGPKPVVLHRIEAAQLGVVVEQAVPDATSALPSWYETVHPYSKKKAEALRPFNASKSTFSAITFERTEIKKPMTLEEAISRGDMAARISAEAARLVNTSATPEDLRRRHVTAYPLPSGLTEAEKEARKKSRKARRTSVKQHKQKKPSKKSKK